MAIETKPVEQVVERVTRKALAATKLKTKDIAQIPVQIRDRALWSAAVDDIRTVQSMQDKLTEWSDDLTKNPDRAIMNRGKFVAEMRQELGAEPGDTGDIEDLTSERRLSLIYNFQTEDAAGYADWVNGQDPDVLDAFPAQELLRVEEREVPRGFKKVKGGLVVAPGESWPERFEEAGGELTDDGRMIALKTDPIWADISAFGRPWPPLDFESGMGFRDIARDEAEELGLLEKDARLEPVKAPFNENATASSEGVDESFLGLLGKWFGGKVKVGGGEIALNG
jgi:hypothetical protein